MIDLPFDPDLVLFGTRVLAWHSFFASVGMLVGIFIVVRLCRSRVPEERTWTIAAWAVGSGFVGARLLHVAERWPTFVADPLHIVAVWDGGMSILGAVIAGFAAMALATRRMRAPVGFVADVGGSVAGIGMGIGRIGDIINGEHHAIACSGLPWCVRYTSPNTLGQTDYVHPAIAYEMLVDFAAAAFLLWLRPRLAGKRPEGRLLWAFLVFYGVGRFFISFLRLDPIVFAGLREAQLAALGVAVVGGVMLARLVLERSVARSRATA